MCKENNELYDRLKVGASSFNPQELHNRAELYASESLGTVLIIEWASKGSSGPEKLKPRPQVTVEGWMQILRPELLNGGHFDPPPASFQGLASHRRCLATRTSPYRCDWRDPTLIYTTSRE